MPEGNRENPDIGPRIQAVADHFAGDGFSVQDYHNAAKAHPTILRLTPERVIGNVEGVVGHFGRDGLTNADYLRAAVTQPPLFYLKPARVISNVDAVTGHFSKDGLTEADYLKAALKQPSLFCQKPATVIANVESVVTHFAKDGLTQADFVRAVLRQPSLFQQRPVTIISNIEAVVTHFSRDGLTKVDYLNAALKQPSLFCQKAATVIGHVYLLRSMHEANILTIRDSTKGVLAFVCARPSLLALSDENLHLRQIASHVTGRTLTRYSRNQVQKILVEHLLGALPDDPKPADAAHARHLLFNALTREGYFKAVKSENKHAERATKDRSENGSPQAGR